MRKFDRRVWKGLLVGLTVTGLLSGALANKENYDDLIAALKQGGAKP